VTGLNPAMRRKTGAGVAAVQPRLLRRRVGSTGAPGGPATPAPPPPDGTAVPPASHAEELDWSAHPCGFGLPSLGAAEQYHTAAVVGKHGAPARDRRHYGARCGAASTRVPAPTKPSYTYADALSWCRFPGALSLPAAALLPPIANRWGGVSELRLADDVTAARAIGAAVWRSVWPSCLLGVAAYRAWFRRLFVWGLQGQHRCRRRCHRRDQRSRRCTPESPTATATATATAPSTRVATSALLGAVERRIRRHGDCGDKEWRRWTLRGRTR